MITPKLYTARLVEVAFRRVDNDLRFAVTCKMCPGDVQVTGEGGFRDVADATALARQHRVEHILTLIQEAGLDGWTDWISSYSLAEHINHAFEEVTS